MRTVADTNVVVSGLLWHGPERRILHLAYEGRIELFTSINLAAELEEVLNRKKFHARLKFAHLQASVLITNYLALAAIVHPVEIPSVVTRDPDDDAVVACAVAAQASVIITGDHDLRSIKQYQGIRIGTAAEILADFS